MYLKISFLAATAAFLTSSLGAQTERELDDHEHGKATLDIAIEGDQLMVDLASPWNNLVGFEHAPGNADEQTAVDDARAGLQKPAKVFDLPGAANCMLDTVATADTMSSHDASADGHEDDHADELADDHVEEHDDEHDGEHMTDADHDADSEESHSEIRISYTFSCGAIDALDAIDVRIGDSWSGVDALEVRLVGPNGQSATELDGGSGRIDLSGVS